MGRLRLYSCLAAFVAVLLLPFVGHLWVAHPRSLAAPPASTGVLRELRVITPHNQDIRRVFEPAFSQWHEAHFGEAVAITYLSPGGTNDIVRYLQDLYGSFRDASGALLPEAQVDARIEVVWGGGDYAFERDFKPLLKPLSLDPQLISAAFPASDLAGVPLYDPEPGHAPKWVGVALSSFGIIHAPGFYAALGLPPPQTWSDLARPELAGLVALADPTRSGAAAIIYMMVLQREMAAAEERWLGLNPAFASLSRALIEEQAGYREALAAGWKEGMRTLLLMAANARYFTDSGSRPCADVGDGESAAGVAIDFYARVYEQEIGSGRIQYHAPRGATAITPDPVGILYGTTGAREQLANRFVQFLLSPEAQRLWNLEAGQSQHVSRSLRRLPARRDVYADRAGWADDENPFEVAEGFNMRQRWMRQLGRLIPVWAAAWIDAKPDLDAAHRDVLAVADPDRRRALRRELSDLPIEYADVLAKRPTEDDAGRRLDPRLLTARERLSLSERFRDHYRAVALRARGAS